MYFYSCSISPQNKPQTKPAIFFLLLQLMDRCQIWLTFIDLQQKKIEFK